MKTIGILGIGPQATIDLELRIHQAAQRLIPQRQMFGYPPMIVYHHRRLPVLVNDNGEPALPLRPDPQFLEAARWLGQKVDFLLISANAPHLFRKEIEAAAGSGGAGKPVLSIIDATIEEVQRRRWRRIGVLGYFDSKVPVYTEPLRQLSLTCETIDTALQPKINDAVMRLIEGRETEESRSAVRDAVAVLRSRNVDGIILGCTELPLLLGAQATAPDLLDPIQILAEAAVMHARSP
ncbi:MAG: aspartate/glutamate racemase family protein [Phycisphaerales bacterium]|nr:aspartate/glutamate racemase family protein [Phycisphaerales bacterium]MCI0674389.1 aspartate/glutamate racemase family protein [Phycisphaerales bacterium]